VKNIALSIRESARELGESVALRHKIVGSWHEISYRELDETIGAVARKLVDLGVQVGDKVAIFAPNCPDWVLADLGIQSIRGVTVPIFATSTAKQAQYIIEDADVRVAFAGSGSEMEKLSAVREACGKPEILVALEGRTDLGEEGDMLMPEFIKSGMEVDTQDECDIRSDDAKATDLATIIYTSGTTGEPKGVMLAHENFVNQFETLDRNYDVTTDDRSLCFLPLSHVFERAWTFFVLLRGAKNSFCPDPKRIAKYLVEARPNVMASAPRLYEKIYSGIFDKLENAPSYRQKLFHWALDVGGKYERKIRNGGAGPLLKSQHALADKLVLSKLREVIGGPKKFMASGGAALSKEIEEMFFAAGLLICQGYGLTETAPMLTANAPGEFRFGTVGKPVVDVELKIAESGEILAKGPNVMAGYFNKPEATAEVFSDGWFHTGDVGHFDEDGFLIITDRIKDLIVTSGGKNVAPQWVETVVGKDPFIEQLAVLGDSRKYISALVVPSFDVLSEWAKRQKLNFESHEDLVRMPEVIRHMTERITRQSKQLAPFEKIKRFTLMAKEFTMQAGEITPTLKVKRRVIHEKYKDLIERMYSKDSSA
jgi:long-chain acyl-CoA synthetase